MQRAALVQNILSKMEAEGISQRRIHRETGISMNTLRAALRGDDAVQRSTLHHLALFLGLSVDQDKTKTT